MVCVQISVIQAVTTRTAVGVQRQKTAKNVSTIKYLKWIEFYNIVYFIYLYFILYVSINLLIFGRKYS